MAAARTFGVRDRLVPPPNSLNLCRGRVFKLRMVAVVML
jgi:hypothetical protein